MKKNDQPARADNIRAIVAYFEKGIKQQANNVGIELEHTLVHSNGEPLSYGDERGQRWILNQLKGAYGDPMLDAEGDIMGLASKNKTVTLEPAAQLELSAGPFGDLSAAMDEFNGFERTLSDLLAPYDMEVLTPGYHPTRRAVDLKLIPKVRYKFMNEYLGAISMFGICMMRGSASTQVSIDYTSVDDCLRKLRLANACVPILSLICDNSPIFEGEPREHQLVRTEIWNHCDPDRCGTVPGIMDEGFTLETYANYILDTPAIVKIEDGKQMFSDKTFGEIFAERPMDEADVEHALSMFFTDVRLKTYVEIRPADAMPVECAIAYAALIKGLFYNAASLDAMDRLFAGVTAEDIRDAKASLMESGYHGYVYHHPVSEMADELISLAATGLSDDEVRFLEPLQQLVSRRVTLADIALDEIQ